MKCDYCSEDTSDVISYPHPNGDIKVLCFECMDSINEEETRAEGEHSEEKKSPI